MRLVRFAMLAVIAVVGIWAGFQLLGWMLSLVVGTVLFAVRLAILGAIVVGAMWAYRKLTRRGRRRGRPQLGSGEGSLDWQFLRGKVDRETYLRRQRFGR